MSDVDIATDFGFALRQIAAETVAIRLTIFCNKNCQKDRGRLACMRLYSTADERR
ncbi:MAG: hypothetical protein LBP59_16930 [Planctomycetaceae bacterium]|nr:hypothetical protein [Planctomycetaceae bacterium]